MAVVIRLARHGQTKRPHYRIVATEKTSRRDGKFIEILGTYYPLTEPPMVKLKEERVKAWIAQGALPSETVANIVKKQIPGVLEAKLAYQQKKTQAARKKRKEAAKKRA